MGILVETPTWSDFVPLVSRWEARYNLRVYVPGGCHNTSLEHAVVVTDMSYDPGSCQLRNTRPSYSMDQIPAFYPAKQIYMACQRHGIAIIQKASCIDQDSSLHARIISLCYSAYAHLPELFFYHWIAVGSRAFWNVLHLYICRTTLTGSWENEIHVLQHFFFFFSNINRQQARVLLNRLGDHLGCNYPTKRFGCVTHRSLIC